MREHDGEDPSGTGEFVLFLAEVGRADFATAGGKGANLGELTRAGFPVPPGFLVTTTAYDRFVQHGKLADRLSRALGREPPSEVGDTPTPPDGAGIRAAFESAPVPSEVEAAVLEAYERLGRGAVAVRSSATAEDLAEAAFAGQQDTFLNIIGPAALVDAVRRCWASLWTDRAIAYRDRQGIDQHGLRLAVVVQRLVSADLAGVMFTANPVTGARKETIIEVSPGLGEAVVSGLATPDHLILRHHWWGWRVAQRRGGQREVMIRALPGGGTEQIARASVEAGGHPQAPGEAGGHPQAPGSRVETGSLSSRTARRLARLGAAIERQFGGPQDVEWAVAGGAISILQARPITALPRPLPAPGRWEGELARMAAELFPARPYPLDLTTWLPAITRALGAMVAPLGLAGPFFLRMLEQEDGVVVRLRIRAPVRPTPAVLLAPIRLLSLARAYDSVYWHDDPLLAVTLARARALEARELGKLSWASVLDTIRETLGLAMPTAGELRRRYFPRAALAAGLLRLLLQLLGHQRRFAALLSGVENKTLEANRELERLAARIRADPELAAAFSHPGQPDPWRALGEFPSGQALLTEVMTFLDQYGHREAYVTSSFEPTWKDAPDTVLGILSGLASAEPRPSGPPAWEAARDSVLKHPGLRVGPGRALFLTLLDQSRCLLQIREDTHFYATMALPILRRGFLELGRRLAEIGALDSPEEVFHLTWSEVEGLDGAWPPPASAVGRLRTAMRRRSARRASLAQTPLIDPRALARREPAEGALVRGTPGSPGVAEGRARIVLDQSQFGKLRVGDVLVAPYTNPAWTPLFQRAAAMVVDSGGAGSHAAIVAREYGIPAVMGTLDATRRLRDDQWVRVDGDHGQVLAAEAPQD